MVVITEKLSSLPRNRTLSFSCLHRYSIGFDLSVSSPLLPVESSNTPQPSLWPMRPYYPQAQPPQKRVHCIHTML